MPTVLERLQAKQAQTQALRERRASAVRERDAYRVQLESAESGDINRRDSPAYKGAQAAAALARQLGEQIEASMAEESNLLMLMADGVVHVPGPNGPEDHAPGAEASVEMLKAKPGRLLASILERRKASASTIPEDLRRRPAADAFLTTADISPITESQAMIDLLQPLSVALASGIVQMQISTTKVRIPRFTEAPVAGWIPELGAFPKSAPGMEMVEVKPPKVGLVSTLSLEVFEDLSPLALALIEQHILKAVAVAYDHGILFGSGAVDASGNPLQPRGIANTTGIAVVQQELTSLKPFAQAIAALIGDSAMPGALFINPLDLASMFELTEATGSLKPLWTEAIRRATDGAFALRLPYFGVPIYPTAAAPQGTALLVDPSTVVAVIRREADIALDPYYGFDTGEVGLRTYLRGDVVVGQPQGAVRITFAPPPATV